MPTTVAFLPGRKKNQRNPVIFGHRFTKDLSRNGNTYYKCTLCKDGCRERITLNEDHSLVSPDPLPSHSHPAPVAVTHVHTVKQNLRRKAAESDLPPNTWSLKLLED